MILYSKLNELIIVLKIRSGGADRPIELFGPLSDSLSDSLYDPLNNNLTL